MTPLDDLLIQAKALVRSPHDPASQRAAAARVRAFEDEQPEIKDETGGAGAGAVMVLIALVLAVDDRDARGKYAEALSIAVDAVRLERAHHAQARLAAREPARHWTGGANA